VKDEIRAWQEGHVMLNYPERPTRLDRRRFWLCFAVRRYTLWLSLAASERA
jgi:hypothetical protein